MPVALKKNAFTFLLIHISNRSDHQNATQAWDRLRQVSREKHIFGFTSSTILRFMFSEPSPLEGQNIVFVITAAQTSFACTHFGTVIFFDIWSNKTSARLYIGEFSGVFSNSTSFCSKVTDCLS